MATSLTREQQLAISALNDRPEELRLKQRQIQREIMRMEIKIDTYKTSIVGLDQEIIKAEQELKDYQDSIK